jgi:beta-1,4-mannooligosaccharide/beta-1,4-mannosyl-N-acetylglucosamine phosphorylase
MKLKMQLVRHSSNPILTPKDLPFEAYTVFNAGVVRCQGGYLLLLRIETQARNTVFHVATSTDGINFEVNPEPIDYPFGPIEECASRVHRFDMRITPLEDTYYVCHAVWLEPWGCSIGIAQTDDFVSFKQISISVPSNRNAVLFPEKINGKYVRLERPQNINGSGIMWISESPDLVYWGNPHPIILPHNYWSTHKTGAGCVPIKTSHGWLEIYHATSKTASSENYHLGVCLLDLEKPDRVLAAPDEFILAAEELYECVGQVPNVVFTGGACLTDDEKLNIYYGAADTRMCLAQTTVKELVDFCMETA